MSGPTRMQELVSAAKSLKVGGKTPFWKFLDLSGENRENKGRGQ